MASELPRSLPSAGYQIQQAVKMALADGHALLQVDIQNQRTTSVDLTRPILEALPEPVSILFATGTAGLAEERWPSIPPDCQLIDVGLRDTLLRRDWKTLVLVDGSSIDLPVLDEIIQPARQRPVLIVNNWPEAPGTIGTGRGSPKKRKAFREKVEVIYYIQATRFVPLVISRQYPGPWCVWEDQGPGAYKLLEEFTNAPTNKDLKRLSKKVPFPGPIQIWNRFWGGPNFFRTW
jgi:Domain of unknown function (DUF1995)